MKKLLIIGAGGHGFVVKEIAENLKDKEGNPVYSEIAFIDDNSDIAIGKTSDIERLSSIYKEAIVSIGHSSLRKELCEKLINAGYTLPVIIDKSAYVSKSAKIAAGTLVEPKAVINANTTIGCGCIISVGAIVDHNATVGDYTQINAGLVVGAGKCVEAGMKVNEDIR